MGSILHDIRHAKDLKQQPIRDKIELAGQFSGYESGQAAGEIISEIVSFIGPAKLAKIAGKSKLISRLSQVPKIEKGLSYIKQARTMLSDNYLSTLARESYGATKDFFRSRLGNLWDDLSYKKFSFAGLDKFRHGEDIGKHTARLYQSTGESAEFQRIRRDLYGEAREQSGRKVGREFSKEASEQFSKNVAEEFVDGKFTDPEVQARYERYLKKKAKQGKPARDPMDWKEVSDRMAKIRNQGRQYELEKLEEFKEIARDVEEQVTIKVVDSEGNIVRTRVDAIGYNKETGELLIREFKSSKMAPLTKNQTAAFKMIEDGATARVVGKGKGIFKGGFEIPAYTEIRVIRPD